MKLKHLLKGIEYEINEENVNYLETSIDNISFSTKNMSDNTLFFCIKGNSVNGEDFAIEAIENGAKIIVSQNALNVSVPNLVVKNVRQTLALCSKAFYGNICDKMKIIGVTGTNGKTTITNIIGSILNSADKKYGIIGTEGAFIEGERINSALTTPDPPMLHKIFEEMYKKGADYIVMEVSAHAIALNKIDGITFDVGIFTNLTEDHLDFFGDMSSYWNAKKNFFTNSYIKYAVVNTDDECGRELYEEQKVTTFGYAKYNPAECFAVDCQYKRDKTFFTLNLLDNFSDVNLNLLGDYNVSNALASAMACYLLKIPFHNIVIGLENAKTVKGRFSVVPAKNFQVIVDFAHTPDAIINVLSSARKMCDGRVICLFGCGGNRDAKKRSEMAKMAETYADYVILTSDNPRFEKPEDIIFQASTGFKKETHIVCVDRVEAIKEAFSIARQGDVLVLCGKGAENTQEISGVKYPYSDFDEVEKAIAKE